MRTLLLSAVICTLAAASAGAAEVSRPDVLLVTIDTLRADHLGSYGFPQAVSPRMDSLAAEGVLFEVAIAASSGTAPSHASILTSRYPREHSIGYGNGTTRLEGLKTLAEIFAEHGYATAAFVGNMMLERRVGLDRGFAAYDDELPQPERNRAEVYERVAADTTARALAWLAQAEDAPVFLWVHLQDPHGPYTPPAELEDRFEVPPQPGEKKLPVVSSNNGWGGIPPYQALPGLSRPAEYRGRYVGEIFYADRHVGLLTDAIDARRPDDGAIVLVTADHGESLGEDDRWFVHFHTTAPSTAHVPMILRAPGLPPGRRAEVVSHVDVMPTLLELAGLEVPPRASGVALGPLLRGESGSLPERFVYCDMGHELSAYRGDAFIRVMDVQRALKPQSDGDPEAPEPLWLEHRWRPGAPARRLSSEGRLDPSIRAYLWDPTPMVDLDAPDADMRRQLRALGYVD